MWDPRWQGDDWKWTHIPGGPSEMRHFEAREHKRHFDFERGLEPWDVGHAADWSMGNAGNWASPAPFPGSFNSPDLGLAHGLPRHLGHLGPPVESPVGRDWARREHRTRGAHWGPHTGLGPRGYRRSDARILEDVCETLLIDGDVDASEIDVTVGDGIVKLGGQVVDRASKRRAEDLAGDVPGVTDVVNEIHIGSVKHRSVIVA